MSKVTIGKNQRETIVLNDISHNNYKIFYDLKKVDTHLASKKEWERRGYKVDSIAAPVGKIETWTGVGYLDYELYHLANCVGINGKKASIRRDKWLGELVDNPTKQALRLYELLKPNIRQQVSALVLIETLKKAGN